jgi:hypothetical protein
MLHVGVDLIRNLVEVMFPTRPAETRKVMAAP